MIAGQSVRFFADQPISHSERDVLRLDDYAAALESLVIGGLADPPFTIAISGPWGAGKSSLAQLFERRLRRHSHSDAWS